MKQTKPSNVEIQPDGNLPALYIGAPQFHSAHHNAHGRGGHRNRKDRQTTELSLEQCDNIWSGAHFSVDAGLPLNRFISINWTTAQVQDVSRVFPLYLKRAGDWLRTRGVGLAYVWVHETDGGRNTHLVIHVPTAHSDAFGRMHLRWLKAAGARRAKGAIDTRPIGTHYAAPTAAPEHHLQNLTEATHYVLKEACPAARVYAGGRDAKGGGGLSVVGKRCGTSVSLGPEARLKAAFIAPAPRSIQ